MGQAMKESEEEQAQARLDKLRAEVAELEERAGISEEIEDTNLGPLFPNLDGSSQEYWDDSEEYARRKLRQLYFEEVSDVELRKAMIAKRRECDSAYEAFLKSNLHRMKVELAKAQHRSQRLPWFLAGLAAAFCVAIGASFFQLYGAIGGALVGFFVGQGMIAKQRTEREATVRYAQSQVDEAVKLVKEDQLSPDWFNRYEASTGERDEEFDHEFVSVNRAEAIRSGALKPDDDL